MAGRIPRDFLDTLLTRVDIVDVVNTRVPLKKTGRDFQARCPFHDEKTPSFTVSREKQFYHCFGCGAHGSAIGFLMEYDHMGFVEAVEDLASLAGIEVPRDEGAPSGPDLTPLYGLLEQAKAFYQQQLRSHPQADRPVAYLKDRGLSGEIAADFGLGFAPPGWDNLLRRLGGEKDRLNLLLQAGLLSEREGRYYDRFRERIMFPIRDHRGRSIAFGGRVLGDATPKYLNSPETDVFHKGRELYGLYEARQSLRELNRLVVVEGYMDVIALAQFGIRYAVATLGTATTPEHVERLFRATPEIIFCFDGDRAGRDAAWKAMNTALPHLREGREARFLFLPEGEDPDTLIRAQGTQAFESALDGSTPLSQFLFDKLSAKVDVGSLDGRARLVELARPYIDKLPRGIFREMMLNRLAELAEIDAAKLSKPAASPPPHPRAAVRSRADRTHMSPVRTAVALLLQHPSLANRYQEGNPPWQHLDTPGIPLLSQLLELIRKRPNLKQGPLLEHWRGTAEEPHLYKLINMELPIPESGIETEFLDALQRLNEQYRKQEASKLLAKTRDRTLTAEEKQHLQRLLTSPAQDGKNGT
jgi:DNA primase